MFSVSLQLGGYFGVMAIKYIELICLWSYNFCSDYLSPKSNKKNFLSPLKGGRKSRPLQNPTKMTIKKVKSQSNYKNTQKGKPGRKRIKEDIR